MKHYIATHYPSVRNVVFDLGNVILDVDFMATIEAFKSLGAKDFEQVFTQHAQHAFLDEWDKGLITPADFRQGLRAAAPELRHATDAEIDAAWCAMLGNLPLVRLEILKALRPDYRLFLLSNTNEIHVNQFTAIVKAVSGAQGLSAYFDKVYYSNEIGMRKPNVETYAWTLSQNDLIASETLFVDDHLPNIEGARMAGMQTLHLVKCDMSLESL